MMLSRVRVLVGGILLAAPVWSVTAQAVAPPIDAGQFVITRNGEPIGAESFTISRVGTGLRATASHREGTTQIVDTLVTDASGSPSSYTYVRIEGTAPTVRVNASRAGNRLTVTSRNRAGDASTKELLVSDGMLLLDQTIYSQLYFLFLPQSGGQAPTLVAPLTWTRTPGVVQGAGPGDVQIGGTRVPTTHFTFGETEIWVSRDHQIVKIEIPTQHLVVTREQPPR